YSDIAAIVYFDVVGNNGPWIINSSPESEAAYREAAQDPWFRQIHTLGWGPAANRADAPPPVPGPGPTPTPGHHPDLIDPPAGPRRDRHQPVCHPHRQRLLALHHPGPGGDVRRRRLLRRRLPFAAQRRRPRLDPDGHRPGLLHGRLRRRHLRLRRRRLRRLDG